MLKTNNYYEIRKKDYNWAPIKLIKAENYISRIEILKNDQQFDVVNANIREITIEKIHLERIGFENDCLKDIYTVPIYMILGDDFTRLTSAYFGYIIFHKDELSDVQKRYNTVRLEVYENFKTNPDIIFDKARVIKDKLNSVLYINEFFERLEQYDIIIENKKEILIG